MLVAAGALLLSACSEADPAESADVATAPAAGDDAGTDPAVDDDASSPDTSEADGSDLESGGEDDPDAGEPDEDPGDDAGDDSPSTAEAGSTTSDPAASAVGSLAGEPWFLGEIPAEPVAADSSMEPIHIGMINQEDTPFGSFPEVRAAAQTATAFINAELGGVHGRPIELHTCITNFNPEQSAACAQELVQQGVVAFVGGVDVTSNGSIPVLERNEVPMVGGIPAGLVEQRSEYAFSFSGGGAGAAAAFMQHAADNGASTVLLAYGEFESFEVAARDYAAAVGENLGLNVELLSFSLFVTDYLPVLTKARDIGADAIIVLAADGACVPVMQGAADLGLDAQVYLTGACATEAIIDAAGESIVGVLFNAEGPVDDSDPENLLYGAALDHHAVEESGGAGTVGFRGMMNLYALLTKIDGDITAESILAAVRATDGEPSFWGHPYTCDGNQVPGLPALCAPQQVLFQIAEAGTAPTGVGDWIDTAALFQALDG